MSLNKACLIGNVCQAPDIRTTKEGKEIASFSLATGEKWKGKDGNMHEKSEFHRIVIFGALVTIVKKWVVKGSKLYLEGQIKTREYVDKDGVKRYTTEIVLQGYNSYVELLGSPQKTELDKSMDKVTEAYDQQNSLPYSERDVDDDSDIPF